MSKFIDEKRVLVFVGIWMVLSLVLISILPEQGESIQTIAAMAGFSLATALIPTILVFTFVYSPTVRLYALIVLLLFLLIYGIHGYISLWRK